MTDDDKDHSPPPSSRRPQSTWVGDPFWEPTQLLLRRNPLIYQNQANDLPSPLPVDIAQLVMKTVVAGEKTSEGVLIEMVTLPWFDIIDEVLRDPTTAFQIPPQKWEEMIAGAYKKAGFDEVTLTPRSGDHGRDVIAIKRAHGIVRVIDQVKAYAPGHLVPANDVRALIGVLQTDGAAKGFLTTTSDFAPKIRIDPTITPFMPSRLELINGTRLRAWLEQLRGRS
jgi:restriction system protein